MSNYIQSMGIIVTDAELVTTATGYKFYAFTFSSRMKSSKAKDLKPVYFSCSMDASKQKLASFLKKGTRVAINGELYCLETYYSEKREEQVVKPKVQVLSVALLGALLKPTTPANSEEERVASPEEEDQKFKAQEYRESELPF